MRIEICGVRGSTPAPGPEFVRTGGNTSCLAVSHDGARPTLVVDAGTGLRAVTSLLGGAPFRGTILLGHLHWDHTHGLPFFAGGDRDDAVVRVAMPTQDGDAFDVLERIMSPPHFPITPSQLRGAWSFDAIDEGTHDIEGFEVVARRIPHTGGVTYGYRITDRGGSFAYLSDHAPHLLGPGLQGFGCIHDAARELCEGVDLLVHDAQYTAAELPARFHFGHAAMEYAVELASACHVSELLLFHHDPSRTDREIEALTGDLARASDIRVDVAREGREIHLR
jgi:phosphoribosyl 1,2-cyclic phosphodiesterase